VGVVFGGGFEGFVGGLVFLGGGGIVGGFFGGWVFLVFWGFFLSVLQGPTHLRFHPPLRRVEGGEKGEGDQKEERTYGKRALTFS